MQDLDRSKFVLINEDKEIKDKPLETKRVGYYKDAWNRFKKNKMSLTAFIIICILMFFVVFGPILKNYKEPTRLEFKNDLSYLPPRIPGIFSGTRFTELPREFIEKAKAHPKYNNMFLSDTSKEYMDEVHSKTPSSNIPVKVDQYKFLDFTKSYFGTDLKPNYYTFTKAEFEKLLKKNLITAIHEVDHQKDIYKVSVKFFETALGQTVDQVNFWFGTIGTGEDLYTQLWQGARISFMVALAVISVNALIGLTVGAISGYYGGTFDLLFDRFVEILSGIPFIAVLTLLVIKYGTTFPVIIFAFTITGWIGYYSMARMQFYRFKNREYILAARTLGASDARIMFRHIFPNAIGYMVTSFALALPSFIFSEASFAYLGILKYGNTISVGQLLEQGQSVMQSQPHVLVFPAIYISILMITFNLFGNGLRDAFNPSLRGVE